MACDSIMMRDPEAIRPETTLPDAAKLTLGHGIRALTVTDEKGIYVGRFTTVHLIELLLRKASHKFRGLDGPHPSVSGEGILLMPCLGTGDRLTRNGNRR